MTIAAIRTRCPAWCTSDHHGEGPGETITELHHTSDTTAITLATPQPNGDGRLLIDLVQIGGTAPQLYVWTDLDHHTELTLSGAEQLAYTLLAQVSAARQQVAA